jgi:biotin--protein ligase
MDIPCIIEKDVLVIKFNTEAEVLPQLKMNVLVYNGPGASSNSVKQILLSLRSLISDHYDILAVDQSVLCRDHWLDSTAMIVMPGGRDLSYCEHLGTKGMEKIQRYISLHGGNYLGIGAGAYFASDNISFSAGSNSLYPSSDIDVGYSILKDITEPRFLKLFSGNAIGSITPGFKYDSEIGSRIVKISLIDSELCEIDSDNRFLDVCVNGSPWFEPVRSNSERVLAFYETPCHGRKAAIIQTKVGKGEAVLCGPHIECDPSHFTKDDHSGRLEKMLPQLLTSNQLRIRLLKSILLGMGMKINKSDQNQKTSKMKLLHLFSARMDENAKVLSYLNSNAVQDNQMVWRIVSGLENAPKRQDDLEIPIIYHKNYESDAVEFKVEEYFKSLAPSTYLGDQLLYGKVVTSTQTILEKNYVLNSILENGTVFVADHQLLGRGRGHNTWISQNGSLQFSLMVEYKSSRTLIFIQYLFALAIVEAIKSFSGYSEFPVFIKWPNDIYTRYNGKLLKLGGILVTSSYENGIFKLVIGCGLNILNEMPTISLSQVSRSLNLDPLKREPLLAIIFNFFQSMCRDMERRESFELFSERYYENWLHSFQKVQILKDGNIQDATLIGVDLDSGYLIATQEDGSEILLHPDGNTFDMLKGLISRRN